ncbi:MAG: hypothetical protein OIF32_12295 [Campylobacterales bacterium]|nr:hypothetical protein [Campylobacterales bacterium]
MQTIHLQVKDDYVANVLGMLDSVKDLMIEKIEFEDEEFLKHRKELHKTLEDYKKNGLQNTTSFSEGMEDLKTKLNSKYGS